MFGYRLLAMGLGVFFALLLAEAGVRLFVPRKL
jgi:hypothetical protein